MPEGTVERPLSPSLPRDCGHECKVCRVTVVSLTDYAGHISSTSHKQNVEAADLKNAASDQDEDYFDRALVELIEKRKQLIRKEEEAAAAAKKAEEEQRKQQEFEQRLKEAKECYRKACGWNQSSRTFSGSSWQQAWNGSSQSGGGQWHAEADSRHGHNSRQGKSATWHAQEPPRFQRWDSGEWAGGSFHSQEGLVNRRWDQGALSGSPKSRLPWLSNGGSANGVYGRNNISLSSQLNRSVGLFGRPLPPTLGQISSQGNRQGAGQSNGHQNREGPNAERNNGTGTKTFGSNPKLDKTCRWSPYPPTKLFDSVPQKDAHPSPSDKRFPAAHHAAAADVNPASRQSRWDQHSTSPGVEGQTKKKNKNKKKRERSSSNSSRSSSAQRDGLKTYTPIASKQNADKPPEQRKTDKPAEQRDKKLPVTSSGKSQLDRIPGEESQQSKSSSKHVGHNPKPSNGAVLQSMQDHQLEEMLKKAKDTMLSKRRSVDVSSDKRLETVLHIVEEKQREHPESRVEAGGEKCREQDRVKAPLPDLIRPSLHKEEEPTPVFTPSSNGSQSIQSVQVSTSTAEMSGPVTSTREDEEAGRMREEEAQGAMGAADEAMQVAEVGQGSESDCSRSSEAQATSGSAALSVTKLGLPSVLKRDLSKHITSKGKAVSHEPNLNSARRVRNVSESRRVESEKESGLKPTVRQLISSSAARRSVNWEQVYQEVCRKKQEQGKGMPRFGIEMVSHDPEELQQEEGDPTLLEGFQWEALMDPSFPPPPRKRCLSESSIAPDCSSSSSSSGRSLFPSQTTGEKPPNESFCQRDRRSSEQRGYSSPGPVSAQRIRDTQQQEEELRLGQNESEEAPKGSQKALQRSDSLLADSSSGAELNDAQGTGKKRRAVVDIPTPEIPCSERNNKRRKIKSKKDRLHVDKLLAVSLREEELSCSLQAVDNSLVQARAALQAAYMEVQRLMVVKQQICGEMSTLRNRRIELLQGMQGEVEDAVLTRVKKEEPMESISAEPDVASALSSRPDAAVFSPRQTHGAPPQRANSPPPSSPPPSTPVTVKQEPVSPVLFNTEADPEDDTGHCAHSTTPELHAASISNSRTELTICQLSHARTPELSKAVVEPQHESYEAPECKDPLLDAVQSMARPPQAKRDSLPYSESKPLSALSPASRRSSEAGSLGDPSASPLYEPSSLPFASSASEQRTGKRVRRLKKRRVLRKAQGATEPPENSDTEPEGDAARPARRLRPRRRASGGSLVSTSTPADGAAADGAGDGAEGKGMAEEAGGPPSPAAGRERGDANVPPGMGVLLPLGPSEVVEIATSESEGSLMESVTVDSQTDSQVPDLDTSTAEPQNLACNEVTSTSELDVSSVPKANESDRCEMSPDAQCLPCRVQLPLLLPEGFQAYPEVPFDPDTEDLPTEGAFEGHQETVNAMQVHNGLLYTCSGDRTVKAFHLVSRKCVEVFEGHSSKVNCLLVSATPGLQHRLYSGSSDQTIRCYSLKTRECVDQFSLPDRVLCLHSRWHVLYAGLANGTVVTFNLKTNKQMDVFECHGSRAVSCLASAQQRARRFLLVGSYDSTISVRDAKSGVLLRSLQGHTKTVLCMKVVNDLVFSGSSDQTVHAHNIYTGELVRIYKGHNHAVTVVAILGNVMVTACLDKMVRVYELQSNDRLQVYGGHKDMVMCMAVHKSMIYTGCYDGSVQAVKLNLGQNYRCLWHGCSLVFGVMEHLHQHVVSDHASSSFQTLKCRWKNCDEVFSARNGSKQVMPKHMLKHVEESKQEA